jgi:hypothetical protein
MTDTSELTVAHPDSELKRRILIFFFQRHLPALRNVEVAVDAGTVVIQGRVNSFYEKQVCLHCCRRVAGVVQVVDNVEVAS